MHLNNKIMEPFAKKKKKKNWYVSVVFRKLRNNVILKQCTLIFLYIYLFGVWHSFSVLGLLQNSIRSSGG